MEYRTERLILRTLKTEDVELLYDYYQRNLPFLREWEPRRPEGYYRLESLGRMIKAEALENERRSALRLYLFLADKQRIIGFTALSNIFYGSYLSCSLGYKLDKDEVNKGYMTEAVQKMIHIAFRQYQLYKIESTVMPRNFPSRRVMEKLNFVEEGGCLKSLKINGKWEDHIRYVLLNSALE